MGLDSYLYREHYFFGDSLPVLRLAKQKTMQEIKSVRVQIMYWRKCNAIHNWFVQNVQDGVDDCGDHTLQIEQLKGLYDTVVTELASRNGGESTGDLEPVEGFFFGTTEKDQWYWKDLERTRDELKVIIEQDKEFEKNKEYGLVDYVYRSSW